MNLVLRSAFAVTSAAAILLPLQQASAKDKPPPRPISASYSKDQCLKDGGKIGRKSGSIICVLPAPAAAAVVKSKSNITNN